MTIYLQLYGTAIDNPASPLLANIVVNDITTTVYKSVPFFGSFMKVYVDDNILALKYNKINTISQHFNTYHKIFQFRIETEIIKNIP